jgi:hypothetical protein
VLRRGGLKESGRATRALYRIRFTYPEGWAVGLGGEWEQYFDIAEGQYEGVISGRFRGANYPRRRARRNVSVGEVQAREEGPSDLVVDVAKLVWEAVAE